MLIADLERVLKEGDPYSIMGDDPDAKLREFSISFHPDRFTLDEEKVRAAELIKKLSALCEEAKKPRYTLKGKQDYLFCRNLSTGDLATIDIVSSCSKKYLAKRALVPTVGKFLDNEQAVLTNLLDLAGEDVYHRWLPKFVEQIEEPAGKTNVFEHDPTYTEFAAINRTYKDGLSGRHVAWIFKRFLIGLGFIHSCGYTHNAIVPEHVLIDAPNHGMRFIGWCHSTKFGGKIRAVPTKYKDWYPVRVVDEKIGSPAMDLLFAVKTVMTLPGVDKIPGRLRTFLSSCSLTAESSLRRDGSVDCWGICGEWSDMLQEVYGKPKFVDLVLN